MGRIVLDVDVVHRRQMVDQGAGDEVEPGETLGVAVHAVGIRVGPVGAPLPAVGNGLPLAGVVGLRGKVRPDVAGLPSRRGCRAGRHCRGRIRLVPGPVQQHGNEPAHGSVVRAAQSFQQAVNLDPLLPVSHRGWGPFVGGPLRVRPQPGDGVPGEDRSSRTEPGVLRQLGADRAQEPDEPFGVSCQFVGPRSVRRAEFNERGIASDMPDNRWVPALPGTARCRVTLAPATRWAVLRTSPLSSPYRDRSPRDRGCCRTVAARPDTDPPARTCLVRH